MKRIFAFLISSFLVLSSFANMGSGRLSIINSGDASVTVVVDGNQIDNFGNAITLDDLRSGYHNIKIYELRNERRLFKIFGNNSRLIYSSSLLLKSQYHVGIIISRSGEVVVSEEPMNRYGRGNNRNNNNGYNKNFPGYKDDSYNDNNDDRRRRGGKYDDDDRWNNSGNYDNNDRRNNGGKYDDYYNGYNQPMNDRIFRNAKETIQRQGFDNDKLMMAKQVISNNNLYTSQVKEIMQLFSFDDYKLDLAKYAYAKTIDKNNYYMVYDAFAFRKSKEDLANFIQSSRF